MPVDAHADARLSPMVQISLALADQVRIDLYLTGRDPAAEQQPNSRRPGIG
ncbi:MAG: hypothetical protein RLW68_05000 [Devosia marina]|uniref:hypothetical protein n=1 Tax=Devosia marina TaxID=2683198 RepID=UPI0032F08DE7